MSNQIYEYGAVPLCCIGITATWRRPANPEQFKNAWPAVCVSVTSDSDEGVFRPASDVLIAGKDRLIALRSAIDAALQEGETA